MSVPETSHESGEDVALHSERLWAAISVVIILVLAGMAAFAGIRHATMPQTEVETIDPTRLHIAGEFIETNLGSAKEPDGSVTVRAIGQRYSFTPQCIIVPVDTPITIRATSADVVHGLLIEGTNINTMLVPGYVSVATARFSKTGNHLMPCQEFCSVGHEGMWGRVEVVDKGSFDALATKNKRVTCVR